jgi:hypothetical protein
MISIQKGSQLFVINLLLLIVLKQSIQSETNSSNRYWTHFIFQRLLNGTNDSSHLFQLGKKRSLNIFPLSIDDHDHFNTQLSYGDELSSNKSVKQLLEAFLASKEDPIDIDEIDKEDDEERDNKTFRILTVTTKSKDHFEITNYDNNIVVLNERVEDLKEKDFYNYNSNNFKYKFDSSTNKNRNNSIFLLEFFKQIHKSGKTTLINEQKHLIIQIF